MKGEALERKEDRKFSGPHATNGQLCESEQVTLLRKGLSKQSAPAARGTFVVIVGYRL